MTFQELFGAVLLDMIINAILLILLGGFLNIFRRMNDETKINVMLFRK